MSHQLYHIPHTLSTAVINSHDIQLPGLPTRLPMLLWITEHSASEPSKPRLTCGSLVQRPHTESSSEPRAQILLSIHIIILKLIENCEKSIYKYKILFPLMLLRVIQYCNQFHDICQPNHPCHLHQEMVIIYQCIKLND